MQLRRFFRHPVQATQPRRGDAAPHCSTANPHPVPTESRWHPPPATADADSGSEQVPVPEVMKVYEVVPEVMKVRKVSEVVSWEVRAMTERMNAPRSVGHAKAVHAAEAVHAAHAAHAVHAAKTAHRLGGQCRWRGKHRHHDSTSNRDFAEHDNPPDCQPPHHESAMQDFQMTKNLFSDSD
jgi:hypothetical protein